MKRVLGLFWQKSWDNLGHVVVFNFIWFALAVPFFFVLMLTVMSPEVFKRTALPEGEAPLAAAPTAPSPSAAGSTQTALSSTEAAVALDAGGVPAAAAGRVSTASEVTFQPTASAIPLFVLLAMAYVVVCAATGFVYFGMADMVLEYDFTGYKYIAKVYLRRGPVLRTIALITLFIATFVATQANLGFYLNLARTRGMVFLVLAGVMLWIVIFITMTFVLALPVLAQRELRRADAIAAAHATAEMAGRAQSSTSEDLILPPEVTLWRTIRTAAVMAMSAPGRTIFVLLIGFLLFLLGIFSGAGVGFFAVAAPAVLFNADVRVHLEEAEGRGEAPQNAAAGSEGT